MKPPNFPFFLVHALALLVFFVPFSWSLLALTALVHQAFCFAFTTGYHRGLCHRSYSTSRPVRFALAWFASSGTYVGVLRWISLHRAHHRFADTPQDPHSPFHKGWMGAYFAGDPEYVQARPDYVEDWRGHRELVWLERYNWVPGFVWIAALALIFGPAIAIYGGAIPAVILMHSVSLLNVFGHGAKECDDETPNIGRSSNLTLLAVLLQGEGWHRQHHLRPTSASFSPKGRGYDPGYWGLLALEKAGLVREVKR